MRTAVIGVPGSDGEVYAERAAARDAGPAETRASAEAARRMSAGHPVPEPPVAAGPEIYRRGIAPVPAPLSAGRLRTVGATGAADDILTGILR